MTGLCGLVNSVDPPLDPSADRLPPGSLRSGGEPQCGGGPGGAAAPGIEPNLSDYRDQFDTLHMILTLCLGKQNVVPCKRVGVDYDQQKSREPYLVLII